MNTGCQRVLSFSRTLGEKKRSNTCPAVGADEVMIIDLCCVTLEFGNPQKYTTLSDTWGHNQRTGQIPP